ncbi:MAG: 4'-phosphopantetheinyl transferase superfamily protein [Planctomycetes bacterium]|nr:4'-phosphopantetheinyl transferase superfamily protein [Planctomycetota bacterium]
MTAQERFEVPVASEPLALAVGDVHVWRCRLQQPEDRRQTLVQALSPEERQRGDKFHFEHHRRQWTIARGFLRAVLGRYLGIPAEEIRFRYHHLGKPALADEQNPCNWQFNLSHSADGALLAIGRDTPLGVDLEQLRPMENMLALARRYFAAEEARQLEQVAPAQQILAFFNCWTRKEAILKACGKGLSLPLDRFLVSFRPGEPARVVELAGQPGEAKRWSLTALQPWPDFVACLARQETTPNLVCLAFD